MTKRANFKFKHGQRVRLLPVVAEGLPEQFGTIVDPDDEGGGGRDRDVWMVELDREHREDAYDNGLREVEEKYIDRGLRREVRRVRR